MPIWGNRNRESAAEDASAEATPAAAGHENDAPAGAVPETGTPSGTAPGGEPRAGEPAPAFWRAQGRPVVLDAEAVVKDPALTGTAREPAETAGQLAAAQRRHDPEVTQAPGEPAVTPDSPGSISPERWSEILVAFVDDPRGSVKMAAEAVNLAIEEVVSSLRARQRALASSWQATEADTEQLRTVLRQYRGFGAQVHQRFGAQVHQMSPAGEGRPPRAS